MINHRTKVEEIQRQVTFKKEPLTFSASSASNILRKRSKKGLDLSSLNQILDIQKEWALVEPRVTFQQLCKETLKEKLFPPVVPEFTTITVGGAVMGAALESSSHIFGQVSDICLEFEVILGNGELVRASPEENSELFYALSGSYGTLGILTQIKLRLIPAKKYVHLTYHSLPTNQLLKFLTSKHSSDYVEGIALNKERGFAITGELTSQLKSPLFRQNHYWSPWYIQHVKKNATHEEWMPLQEYLFRHDRGAFWMGQYILSIPAMLRLLLHIGIPKLSRHALHPPFLFRLLFGWALSSDRLYKIWHNVPQNISEKLFLVHDFYTPFSAVPEVYQKFVTETEIFPIWLCPLKGTRTPQILAPHFGNSELLNIGLYGMPKSSLSTPELSARLEKEIVQFGGRKMLYSYTYYDQKTFSEIYDDRTYTSLRKKFFADRAFPHIYNKIVMC